MTMAEHNDLIPLLRVIAMPTTKQPGRRFGRAPKPAPKHRPSSPSPMSDARREEVYTRVGGFTARQFRQLQRMGARAAYREAVRRG